MSLYNWENKHCESKLSEYSTCSNNDVYLGMVGVIRW